MKTSPLGLKDAVMKHGLTLIFNASFRRYYLMAMSTTWFHLSALSEALGMGSNKETSAETVTSHES
jgi:hypothetical protein